MRNRKGDSTAASERLLPTALPSSGRAGVRAAGRRRAIRNGKLAVTQTGREGEEAMDVEMAKCRPTDDTSGFPELIANGNTNSFVSDCEVF